MVVIPRKMCIFAALFPEKCVELGNYSPKNVFLK